MNAGGAAMGLLRTHAEVLFRVDAAGRLTRVNEPGEDTAPRLFLARGTDSMEVWFRRDVSDRAAAACRAVVAALPPWDGQPPDSALFQPLRDALALDGPPTEETCGPAYRFGARVHVARAEGTVEIDHTNAALLDPHFPYTRSVLDARRPIIAIVVDGAAVSACYSARQTAAAAEAGVATEEAYQGRGFASQVVIAWRDAVERSGRTPLYSTSWTNTASRAVARKLGLIAYADTLALS